MHTIVMILALFMQIFLFSLQKNLVNFFSQIVGYQTNSTKKVLKIVLSFQFPD